MGGVELFGTRAEEPVSEPFDDAVLAFDLGMGERKQVAGFAQLLFQPLHPRQQGGEVWMVRFGHVGSLPDMIYVSSK